MVKLHGFALGGQTGAFNLYFDQEGSGLASLNKRRLDHLGVSMSDHIEVQVKTLDDWIKFETLRPVVALKLDVEGSELAVLRGATETLGRLDVIQFEFGGTMIDSRTFFQDFWYLLSPHGFRIFRLTPLGLRLIPRYSELEETFTFTNYVAIKD